MVKVIRSPPPEPPPAVIEETVRGCPGADRRPFSLVLLGRAESAEDIQVLPGDVPGPVPDATVTDGCPDDAAVSGVIGATVSRSPSNVMSSTRKSVQSAMMNRSPVTLLTSPERFGAWLMTVAPVLLTAKFEQLTG